MKELLLNVLAFVVTAGIIGILAHILGEKLPRAKFDPEKSVSYTHLTLPTT